MQMKWRRNMKNRRYVSVQDGFTLIELIVVIGVILSVIAMSLGAARQWMRWMKEIETKRKLESIRKGMETVYRLNAWSIDSTNANTLVLSINGVQYSLTNGPAESSNNLAALQAIASISGIAQNEIGRDSMRHVLQVYVSDRLQDAASGVFYHAAAVVSPGWDGTLDSTFDRNTGVLAVNKDDSGFVITGMQYQIENVNNTLKKMYAIRDLYQNYFTILYMQSADKNVYVNRFANRDSSCSVNPYWDQSSGIRNTNCAGGNTTISSVGAASVFGLNQDSIMSAWGREMRLDNHSSSTRNPDTTGLSTPYTAHILADLPWNNAVLEVVVNGVY